MIDNQGENADALASASIIPTITWQEYKWEGTITLPEWEAFNKGRGAWQVARKATNIRRRKREKRAGQERFQYADADEPIQLVVYSPLLNQQAPPDAAQIRAYHHLMAHEAELLSAVLAEFKKNWSEITLIYDHSDDDPNRHSMPMQLRAPEELCGLTELHQVYIHEPDADGIIAIGLALSCDWDTEHGLGVYSCNGKVMGLGSGDLAFGGIDDAFISLQEPS